MVTSRNQHAFTLLIINLLIARYYVHLARSKLETPRLDVFIVLLKTKIQCEREIAIKTENHTEYRNKWTSLYVSDIRCDFSG